MLAAAAVVTLHEIKLPYRTEWQPATREIWDDVLFMIVVQVALPYLLSITVVILIADYLRTSGIAVGGLWPHNLPVAAQACLMLLLVELPRYLAAPGVPQVHLHVAIPRSSSFTASPVLA